MFQPGDRIARLDIVPGRAIGPFTLGTKLADALASLPPTSADRITVERRDDGIHVMFHELAILASFDAETELCTRIWLRGLPEQVPVHVLGNRITTLSVPEVTAWLRTLGPLEYSYGCVDVPSRGIGAFKWERDDPDFYCLEVVPPT